jgi:hypothetical protein
MLHVAHIAGYREHTSKDTAKNIILHPRYQTLYLTNKYSNQVSLNS